MPETKPAVSEKELRHRQRAAESRERRKLLEDIEAAGDVLLLGGLRVPKSWLPLPERAAREDELEWLHSQRLYLVSYDRDGHAKLGDLSKATCPPPSAGALALLRDVAHNDRGFFQKIMGARTGSDADGENERGEKRAQAEIREILKKFVAKGA
jgi:hypothetical protein